MTEGDVNGRVRKAALRGCVLCSVHEFSCSFSQNHQINTRSETLGIRFFSRFVYLISCVMMQLRWPGGTVKGVAALRLQAHWAAVCVSFLCSVYLCGIINAMLQSHYTAPRKVSVNSA